MKKLELQDYVGIWCSLVLLVIAGYHLMPAMASPRVMASLPPPPAVVTAPKKMEPLRRQPGGDASPRIARKPAVHQPPVARARPAPYYRPGLTSYYNHSLHF